MDREVKAWKARVIKREAEAAREKAMKDAIFSELRQEFGYDINPHDPMFRVTLLNSHLPKLYVHFEFMYPGDCT